MLVRIVSKWALKVTMLNTERQFCPRCYAGLGATIQVSKTKPLVSVEYSGPELSYLYVCCGDKIFRRKTKSHGLLYFK